MTDIISKSEQEHEILKMQQKPLCDCITILTLILVIIFACYKNIKFGFFITALIIILVISYIIHDKPENYINFGN